jgi:hypothetical protein
MIIMLIMITILIMILHNYVKIQRSRIVSGRASLPASILSNERVGGKSSVAGGRGNEIWKFSKFKLQTSHDLTTTF